ncbi:aromatic amino acid transporter AroP [Telmatospirillum siberiense]|uniref:Aromatic amino acid transporter AroP n=1 Tax=Telmatospirillum siberiense TaxID=382514 RepID=A0A2N3PSA7_9PROT|nr:aromatic amino acid transporter AroP [Telmatospirillum siberiense]
MAKSSIAARFKRLAALIDICWLYIPSEDTVCVFIHLPTGAINNLSARNLSRGLENRHIQMIALGGAIGTGLFLGVAQTIRLAGPSILLGYGVAGLIAFLIMRQLAEMVVEYPVAGSFSHFAYRHWGEFAGFLSGWNYWVLYVLVSMAELTAVGVYIQYWWPQMPTWLSGLVFFAAINVINMLHVKMFGEMEFWFSIIKVGAIVGMILFGSWLLVSKTGGAQVSVSNLWALGGFLPNGLYGLTMAMAPIMFSFGGLELIGITTAEARHPEQTIPKATNQLIYRILLFYVGALAVLLSLYPWTQVREGGSPFVLIFQSLDNGWVATALNVVVLTAALSVYNSSVYCNSRMLLGLAEQGNAPGFLTRLSRKGVPLPAQLVSSGATGLCVVVNYLVPENAFQMLMMLVVAALIINWGMISLTHLKFRSYMRREERTPQFRSPAQPFSNYLCLVFMAGILMTMAFSDGIRVAVFLIPPWILLLWLLFGLRGRLSRRPGKE